MPVQQVQVTVDHSTISALALINASLSTIDQHLVLVPSSTPNKRNSVSSRSAGGLMTLKKANVNICC
jgi:hypothetical protein